ncbi:hypothetical protein SprV_0200960600 [Sparganum proliferum]
MVRLSWTSYHWFQRRLSGRFRDLLDAIDPLTQVRQDLVWLRALTKRVCELSQSIDGAVSALKSACEIAFSKAETRLNLIEAQYRGKIFAALDKQPCTKIAANLLQNVHDSPSYEDAPKLCRLKDAVLSTVEMLAFASSSESGRVHPAFRDLTVPDSLESLGAQLDSLELLVHHESTEAASTIHSNPPDDRDAHAPQSVVRPGPSASRNRETSQPENRRDRLLWFYRLWSHLLCLRHCDSQTFPVDTGAQISVVPPTAADRRFPSPGLRLQAANCSPIPTVDSLSLTLNIGLRRSFTWIFVIADVPHAILGSDFLDEFDLLADCRRACLLDRTTGLSVRGLTPFTAPTNLSVLESRPRRADLKPLDRLLALVFDRLGMFGVVLNPFKCVLGVPSLEFLGHPVDSEGLRPHPSKGEAIRDFPPPTSRRQLQRFLDMVNFYRRFLPNCADLMLPLTNMLSGPKGPFELTGEALTAFQIIKNSLADANLLTHPAPEAQLSLMVDASTVAVDAVLQQHLAGSTRPLAFFSKKLLPVETRYSTFGRELLAIYLAVKHLRHFFESRDFIVFTDHKPLTFALRSHSDKCNPRKIAHLDYISHFTTDIRHIDGTNNEVADMLSRPSPSSLKLSPGIDLCAVAAEQQRVGCPGDESVSGLQLKDVPLSTGSGTILCDVSTPLHNPFVPASMRRAVFQTLHGLPHPGIRASKKLLAEMFVWPGMNKDVKAWARSCLSSQRSKVQRHNKS